MRLLGPSAHDGECSRPSYGCTLCCVPFGTRRSSQPTGDGTLSFQSGRERVTLRSVTTRELLSTRVLARVLLDRIHQKSVNSQLRHEWSEFIFKKDTIDRILALRVLTEFLRDFRTGLLAACVDLPCSQVISRCSTRSTEMYSEEF